MYTIKKLTLPLTLNQHSQQQLLLSMKPSFSI